MLDDWISNTESEYGMYFRNGEIKKANALCVKIEKYRQMLIKKQGLENLNIAFIPRYLPMGYSQARQLQSERTNNMARNFCIF